jgi:ABC-type lipoprotein release transport system permease subunit
MYLKLMIRGLLRYSKKSRKLIILISVCTAVIVFLLALKESFYIQYETQAINIWTGHLNIVSPESDKLSSGILGSAKKDELALINVDNELEDFILNLDYVEAAAPVIETDVIFFSIDGEPVEYGYRGGDLLGIDPDKLPAVFPDMITKSGNGNFTYSNGMSNIPMLISEISGHNIIKNNDVFLKNDFRFNEEEFELFKLSVISDFPSVFSETEELNSVSDEKFLECLNTSLSDPFLYVKIPEKFLLQYNWKIDDLIFEISNLNTDQNYTEELAKKNKRIYQALYPDAVTPVPNEICLNKLYTAVTTDPEPGKNSISAVIIPVVFNGFVQSMPVFGESVCLIDIEPLHKYLNLADTEYTSYVIRLKDVIYLKHVKEQINNYLVSKNLNYRVIDYKQLGRAYLPIAAAFSIIINILIVLFIIIIIIFMINLIMLSIIKRRKEIGTAVSMGMSKNENIFVLLGEVFFILTLAWLAGSAAGSGLVMFFSIYGFPGMFFFFDDRLFFIFSIEYLLNAYVMLMPPVLIAAVIPMLSIYKLNPAEILHEVN